MKVVSVETGSTGEDLGLRAGDEIVAINGKVVNDVLDYRFLISEEELELEVASGGRRTIFEVEKDPDDDLGLSFEEIQIRYCGNDCPFCFVDQNPAGMRSALYFRDEDFRLSFLSGHYVTLTNLSRRDMERIVTQRLSPLFVSIHATDAEVRKFLFGIAHDDRLLSKLEFLTGNDIEIHTQVVLCPGINDGEVLTRTITELAALWPNLRSVSIVPVGLTKHRQGLKKLDPVTPEYAGSHLQIIDDYASEYMAKTGEHFVYAGDEFYLMAGKEFASAERYDGFYQKENGVGLVRYMLDEFEIQRMDFPAKLQTPRKATFVTATLASAVLEKEIMPVLNEVSGFDAELVVVENDFYGHSVHVTGLLTGQDIFRKLCGVDLGDEVCLPASCVKDGSLFLDDWTVAGLSEKLGVPVRALDNDFLAVFEEA